jgi:hypothetical protein
VAHYIVLLNGPCASMQYILCYELRCEGKGIARIRGLFVKELGSKALERQPWGCCPWPGKREGFSFLILALLD